MSASHALASRRVRIGLASVVVAGLLALVGAVVPADPDAGGTQRRIGFLQSGDCFASRAADAFLWDVVVVFPCTGDAWTYRVIGIFRTEHMGGPPDEVDLLLEVAEHCSAQTDYWRPSPEAWDEGERRVICYELRPGLDDFRAQRGSTGVAA